MGSVLSYFQPTHCYKITHGRVVMWPLATHPGTNEAEAWAQFEAEKCGSLGDIRLLKFALIRDPQTGALMGYDVDSKVVLAEKKCAQ